VTPGRSVPCGAIADPNTDHGPGCAAHPGPSSSGRRLSRSGHRGAVAGSGRDGTGRLSGVPRRLLALAACALLLTACRVDVTVDVEMAQNGSGRLVLTVDADAAVAQQAPGLAEDLRLDDLAAAGWSTDGVRPTPTGGLTITLVRPFDTPEQATALLSTLNGPAGPLQALRLERTATPEEITYTLTGSGRLDGGLAAFADTDLLVAVGGTPYAEQIAAGGISPDDTDAVVGVTVRVRMPGAVRESTAPAATDAVEVVPVTSFVRVDETTVAPSPEPTEASGPAGTTDGTADAAAGTLGGSVVSFAIPLDGTETPLQLTTAYSLERGTGWSALATVLFVLFVGWLVVAVVLVALATRSQRRRARAARRVDRNLYRRVFDEPHG
jgi:hypothetical protein